MVAEPLLLGTRGSALALWQARHVQAALHAVGHRVTLREIRTQGDRIVDTPLAEIGAKGLFTQELDEALLDGRIHLAVHSLKDLQTRLPAGVVLAAVGERAEPWDAFVAHPSFDGQMEELPKAAVLATSSLRRQAQLKAWRPDLRVVPVRGNVDTRLRKLDADAWHGIILATAGLTRLGLDDRIRARISPEIMLPAVGQGALGIVCAEADEATRGVLRATLHHTPTSAAVTAERAFLRRLEGGCQAPIGAYAHFDDDGRLVLEGFVASLDGSALLRDRHTGDPSAAERLGLGLAETLLARGAQDLLDAVRSAL